MLRDEKSAERDNKNVIVGRRDGEERATKARRQVEKTGAEKRRQRARGMERGRGERQDGKGVRENMNGKETRWKEKRRKEKRRKRK